MIIFPEVAFSTPAINIISEVFPEPEGPTILTISPLCTSSVILCRILIGFSLGPVKFNETLSSLIMLLSVRILIILFLTIWVTDSNAASGESKSILLFGDSIVAGYGVVEENSLPVKLEAYFREQEKNIKVINGGVSGDTTGGGSSRLEWTLKQHKPDVVIIALGGNDMLRGISPDIVKKNIAKMLAIVTKENIPVILSSVKAPLNLGLDYAKQFNEIYPNLADEYDVSLYPFFLEKIYMNRVMMQPDGIHPNANGVNEIVNELGPYIDKFLDEQ